MAREHGHEILRSATDWNIVKGKVGRQYNDSTPFKDVLIRLEEAFDLLTSANIYDCIIASNKNLEQLHDHIHALDEKEAPNQYSDAESDGFSDASNSESDSESEDETNVEEELSPITA
ncbi:hypothetical protein AC1031_004367 [Aphanomyces cochlioides]|nr:hypothetical protein AC1031_004367 [Aphanomyces cochlioides]